MSLSMSNHVDSVFYSGIRVNYTKYAQAWVNGRGVESAVETINFYCTVQPLNPRELNALGIGNEREKDYRKIYINSGRMDAVNLQGRFTFSGEEWKVVNYDHRPNRNYLKVTVTRIDK